MLDTNNELLPACNFSPVHIMGYVTFPINPLDRFALENDVPKGYIPFPVGHKDHHSYCDVALQAMADQALQNNEPTEEVDEAQGNQNMNQGNELVPNNTDVQIEMPNDLNEPIMNQNVVQNELMVQKCK